MSHSYSVPKDPISGREGTAFHYNADFSGDVTILVPFDANEFKGEVRVPAEHLLRFVADAYIHTKQRERLEEVNWRERLMGRTTPGLRIEP